MMSVSLQFLAEVDSTAGERVENCHADKHNDGQKINDVVALVLEVWTASAEVCDTRNGTVVVLPDINQLQNNTLITPLFSCLGLQNSLLRNVDFVHVQSTYANTHILCFKNSLIGAG